MAKNILGIIKNFDQLRFYKKKFCGIFGQLLDNAELGNAEKRHFTGEEAEEAQVLGRDLSASFRDKLGSF